MLNQVHATQTSSELEVYIKLANEDSRGDHERDKTILVKSMNLNFNDLECQVLNFTDITTQKRLQSEQ